MTGPSTGDDRSSLLVQQLATEIRNRRKTAGLSQPQLAALIGYTRQYVSLAERPKRGLPSAELVKAIDDALGAEGALVDLRQQAHTAQKACRAGTSRSKVVDGADTTGPEPDKPADSAEVRNAKRRELVTLAAAITFGASLDEPVERILAAVDERQVPTRVRPGDVAHLRWATAMRKSSCTPAVRAELAATTADLADIAAWFTFDAGQHEPARGLSLLGLQAARESGDLGMRANVASGLARQEIRQGNWAAGLELTQLALIAGDALTPNAIADLHIVNAFAYARKRDTVQCRRCMGAATDIYRPDSISSDPPWLRSFTPALVERELTYVMCDLVLGGADVGDGTAHRLALIERFSTAFHQCPPDRTLSKASIAARLATLLYLEGEQHTAHQKANEAVSLAEQVRSARLTDDLRVLLRALPQVAD